MDKLTVETTFFRRIAVHLENVVSAKPFFRPIPVQTGNSRVLFPLHTRSLRSAVTETGNALFPEHIRSVKSVGCPSPVFFRPIPVHFLVAPPIFVLDIIHPIPVHIWQEQ